MVQGEKSSDEALDDLQSSLEDYATEQGFTLE
jgi:multiple sugar transport system substrate-binding protein